MANLTARFQMIDEMSQKMANLAAGGQTMLDKWESAGDAASAAMDAISSSASYAVTAADGVATSIDSIEQAVSGADSAAGDLADVLDQYGAAADEAAQKTSYWTSAVGGYDKAMMEATYSTQELVDMGVKSTAALDDLNDMMSLCEKSSDNLSKSVEASAGIHDALTASIKKTDDQLDELMQNEKLSTDTKKELEAASDAAAEALKELAQAQLEADAAMQNYQAVMQSGTEDLGKLEAAAEQVGHASESLAAANGKASDATDELAKTTQKASDEADKAAKTGTEAVTTIAQALAAAGITATIKEITSAVYDMTNAYSDAEKIIVNATGATGDALDGLGASALKAFSQNDDALSSVAGAVGEINTRLGYTGDTLSEVTGQFLDFADITGQEVVGSVQLVTKIMNKWGEDASKLPSVLDDLAYAGQISGLSVTTLSNTLITGASSLQEMGLSLENAIGLLAKMELYGVEGTSTITAMRTAVKNFAADGLDAQEALQDTITEIANMKDSSEATTKAVEVFGSKVGVDFARAIRDGAITTDTLTGSLDEAAGTLERTAAAGESLSEKWEKANNKMTVAFTQTLEPTIHDASAELAELWGNVGDFLSEHPNVVKALTAVGAGLGAVAVGVAGISAATIFASATVQTFLMTMAPFAPGLLAAAVTAVTAAVTMLGNKYEDTYDEAMSMTATTAAQTKELESLKEQYDKACRTYGSTSDQASDLKYRIDELSDSLENNGQSVDEYVSNLDSVISKHNDLIDSFGSNTQAIHNSEVENLALVAQLDALASSTGNNAEKQAQMETIINELNGSIDGLNLTYEDLTENQSKAIASVKEMAKQQAEQELQKEKYQEYVDLLKQQATEQETIKENNDAIAAAQERVNEAQKVYDDYIADLYAQDPTGMATISAQWSEQAANLNAANEELQKYQDKQGELQKALDDTSDRLEVIDRYYTQQAEDAKAAGSEIISQQEAVSQAYNDVRADVEKLCEAYDAAYKAAKDSFEGQFGLFDEASTKSEDYLNASVAAAQAALDSQLNYWNTYTANIETLKGTSYQDLGITEDNYKALMSYVQDGSEQAAGLAASMVKAINSGNKDAVSKLANTLADVAAKQDEAAQATADWVTGYEKQLDEFERKMLDTVEGMDMSLNAKAQAEKTLDGYIQGIKNGKKDAVAAAKDVAASVAAALQNSSTYTPTTPTPTVPGHAGGTTDAEDVFIAGEEGPELIVGKQGSTVFPAEETEKIIDALNGIDDAPATATAAPASETTYNTVTDDHSVVDSHDVANEYAITDSHAVTDSHDLTDASVLNDSHDVTSIDNSAQTVDSHDVAESYTTDNSVESHITQEQAGTEKRFSQFLQALAGISIDAPEPAPGESLLASTLGKVADILSGKNSDLPEIEAAYMGLSATPQGATETYDLTELEDILTQQPTAPVAADEQQATAAAVPASETPEPVEPAPLNVLPVATAPQSAQNTPAETIKRIVLELVGKGTIEVSGGSGSGLTKNEVLELLIDNIKPVLMGVIKDEIFEEGQLSYDY
jgi:TP901 family phage tail tape measure protein